MSGREGKAGWRNGVLFFPLKKSTPFPPSSLSVFQTDSEEEENEGVNRSDYQGGLMVLTVPI